MRAFAVLLFWLAIAFPSVASDTIVLKNGRRIVALSAVEDGDKIRYETSAGELSLPKSMVDHIERGTGVSVAGESSRAETAANMGITPPSMAASAEIEKAAVHDGAMYNQNMLLVQAERRMMEQAQEVVLLIDSAKFGQQALSKLGDLSEIDIVVADSALSEEYRDAIQKAGCQLLLPIPASEAQ